MKPSLVLRSTFDDLFRCGCDDFDWVAVLCLQVLSPAYYFCGFTGGMGYVTAN